MPLPWYLKPDWLLYADMLGEQARIGATSCARCGKRQAGNRNAHYSCQTPFQYENE